MIPTSLTGSSPAAVPVGSSTGSTQVNDLFSISGTGNAINGSSGPVNNYVMLGIASLILEGRAMVEDEYVIQTSRTGNSLECGRQSPKPSTSRAALDEIYGVGSSGSSSTFSIDLANYQARKASNFPELSSSLLHDYYNSSSESASSSVESTHSRWSQKLSQLRQESPNAQHQGLAARQQVTVECPRGSDAEYVALAINSDNYDSHEERKGGGDFEILKRMSISQMNFYNLPPSISVCSGSRRGGNSSGGGSRENFMCSLQSLASNTCLRVGSNSLLATTTSPPRHSSYRQTSNSSRLSIPFQYQQQIDQSAGQYISSSDSGIQSPRSANTWCPVSPSPHIGVNSSDSSNGNNKEYLLRKTSATEHMTMLSNNQIAANSVTFPSSTPAYNNLHSNTFVKKETLQNSLNSLNTNTTATAITSNASRNQIYPQQGPHCDQFLRKMGLAKSDASETEEHHCDISYVHVTCTRWRAYCIKMENILARGEPICIEVYLGPVGHKVLLEQWIITQKEKQPPPTMTLPSLCSAIRSQLYFSQISAWCDLIKKSDKTIYETGRVIYTTPPITSAAGDLAITTANNATASTLTSTTSTHNPTSIITPLAGSGGSANGSGGVVLGCGKGRPSSPRLNIFYCIKQYDNTACFNSKPNVHNFPNVNISENCSVSVCLKSLPRISGGIPKLGILTTQQQQQQHQQHQQYNTPQKIKNTSATEAPESTSNAKVTLTVTTTTTTANVSSITNANKSKISIMNCDNNDNLKEQQQYEKTLTATSTSMNGNKSKQSSSPVNNQTAENVDFEYEWQNFDLSAGGDGSSIVGGSCVGDCDSSNSSFSTNKSFGNLSHREKQLLKYRKRMMKRDKKQQLHKTNEIFTSQTKTETNNIINIMEQDENDDADGHYHRKSQKSNNAASAEMLKRKDSIKDIANGQRQELPNNLETINSIPATNHQQQQHIKMISTGTQTINNTCTSCGLEKSMICLKCNPLKSDNASNTLAIAILSSNAYEEMDAESSSSTASSLSSSDIIHTPRNKAELLLQAIQRTPKSNKKNKQKSKDSTHQQQHQQNSPQQQHHPSSILNTNNNHIRNSANSFTNILSQNGTGNMDNIVAATSNSGSILSCQVCKRQKTQHYYNPSSMVNDLSSEEKNTHSLVSNDDDGCDSGDEENETDGGKMLSTDYVDNLSIVLDINAKNSVAKMSATRSCDDFEGHETMEEEYFESSTKLTPQIDRCSINSKSCNVAQLKQAVSNGCNDSHQKRRSCLTPPLQEEMKNASNSEGALMMAQFKTPTPSEQHQNAGKGSKIQQPQQPHKQTPKLNLLHIACNFNKNDNEPQISKSSNHVIFSTNNTTPTTQNPLLLRRSLPKVNLTPIFCNPTSMMAVTTTTTPISIDNGVCNGTTTKSADINIAEAPPTFSFESPTSPRPSLTVQKSNSAPTLPNSNSNSLSPRFIKSSAIYKRRSRHLSDRSDRSSLGSDEQYSDEDIDSGMCSPFVTSPVKLRTRLAAVFDHKPLLGNLEECLLQRRLMPKVEVVGFKLLLGASGRFCPTQLTIPAAAYFYELKGETLSTPYLCEARLPRKGYTVPRCGTVQATLLNPMGMVVRMFVIPYDMRDMPSLHQTFIRQRILADTGMRSNINDINQTVSGVGDDKEFNDGNDNATINTKQLPQHEQQLLQNQMQQRSPQCSNENHLGHFISAENMKSLRYSIHLRFQTSRSGRLMLHTDIRLLISRRTDCDTAAAHAKGVLEAPNELITNTVMPTNPKYSSRQDQTSSKI